MRHARVLARLLFEPSNQRRKPLPILECSHDLPWDRLVRAIRPLDEREENAAVRSAGNGVDDTRIFERPRNASICNL